MRPLILLALVAVSRLACATPLGKDNCPSSNPLIVETTTAEAHGFINEAAPLVRQWLGIPYAEPPLKELRFQPPVKKAYAGAVQAKYWAPSCMQQINNGTSLVGAQMPGFIIANEDSEDCLYLNVFAPLNPKAERLPVLIWIYGGGLTAGGSDEPYYLPSEWIQRKQDHVVVTMK